jgi:hypothetical protein
MATAAQLAQMDQQSKLAREELEFRRQAEQMKQTGQLPPFLQPCRRQPQLCLVSHG